MAIVSNTLLTFSAIGNREDLIDKIYNISPTDVPVQSLADETSAKATFHEWQTESLNAAAANAQLQGDDVSFGAAILTTRVGNRTQISRKEVVVAGTQEAVDKAGRNSEMVRQMANKRAELKRDCEFVICSNQAPVTGNSTTAPQLRPLLSWYATNVSGGTSAANGSSTTARTDGTQRTFTESLMTAQMQAAWIAGGKPSVALCGPKQRAVISSFSGGATKFYSVEDKRLTATITVYDGDFGTLKIVPSRFVRGGQTGADREVQILDPSLIAIAYLPGRKFKTLDLATTGDAIKGAVLSEYTVEFRNEAGCALVADLS
jgi:hypothetical protein